MLNPQDAYYGEDVDYLSGSPHLAHPGLNKRLVELLRNEIDLVAEAGLPRKVLEIGAGHGHFTGTALAAGCEVTAIEMARASVAVLERRFGSNESFRAILSPDGSITDVGNDFSMVLCVSVLHHIPDYLKFLEDATGRLAPGGSLISLQDPLFYERLSRGTRSATRASYGTWRLGQGELRRAFETWRRRREGIFDETLPADMVEYHVVRAGVDEEAIRSQLEARFATVEIKRYWSTQLAAGQRLGDSLRLENTFGVIARRNGAGSTAEP